MSRRDIYIYGAGGLGREILSLINNIGQWTPAGFIDDGVPKGSLVNRLEVIGGKEVFNWLKDEIYLAIAIGDPQAKSSIIKSVRHGINFPTLIHPSAILQDRESINIGEGTVITAGCVLTTQITIGKHVLINLNSTVGHDVQIGNFSSIMPGVNIAGEVVIGDSVMVGSGANILNRMVISNNSRVGMGAVVTKPVAPNTTVVGVPAKPVNK